MSEVKEKDRILAQIKAFKKPNEIAGLSKHLNDLERDGHVSVWRDEQGGLICVRITQSGKDFLDSGGYEVLSKIKRNAKLRKVLLSPVGRIVEAVIIASIMIIAGWWLKDRYGISDNPECADANVFINDSTSLSSASESGLNEDSVASRAKWSGVSLDNAKSTLESDSIRILEIETSAKHSNVRDESKAVPSGK